MLRLTRSARAILLLASLAVIATGCAPIYYPNAPQTALPVEQGEMVASVRAGTSGIEVQAATTPARNLVVAASGTYLYIPGEGSFTSHRYGELAIGWSDTSGRAFMSALGGAGLGWTATPPGSHFAWDGATFDSARYVRIFAQATLGSLDRPRSIRDGERANGGFALGLRAAWVRATELWIDEHPQPAVSEFFLEPFAAWHNQGERFGTVVDLGVSMNPRGGMRFHHAQIRLGVALVYGFAELF